MSEIVERDEFDFSGLEPVYVSVKGPDGREYELREASGAAGKKYKNARTKGLHFAAGELSQLEGAGELEPLLVSLCLFDVTQGGAGGVSNAARPLTQPFVEKTFKARMIKKLYDKAYEISDLAEGNPTQDALKLAFARADSPIKYEDLKTFVDEKLVQKEYKVLRTLFKEDPSKNSQMSTTTGSESATPSEED